jgi:hypothetical protein
VDWILLRLVVFQQLVLVKKIVKFRFPQSSDNIFLAE